MLGFARSSGHLIIERRGRRRSGGVAKLCLLRGQPRQRITEARRRVEPPAEFPDGLHPAVFVHAQTLPVGPSPRSAASSRAGRRGLLVTSVENSGKPAFLTQTNLLTQLHEPVVTRRRDPGGDDGGGEGGNGTGKHIHRERARNTMTVVISNKAIRTPTMAHAGPPHRPSTSSRKRPAPCGRKRESRSSCRTSRAGTARPVPARSSPPPGAGNCAHRLTHLPRKIRGSSGRQRAGPTGRTRGIQGRNNRRCRRPAN